MDGAFLVTPLKIILVRMEYVPSTLTNLLIQQLNRKAKSRVTYIIADAQKGVAAKIIYLESDEAWVDLFQLGRYHMKLITQIILVF